MQTIDAHTALLPEGWVRDIRLTLDDAGRIASIDQAIDLKDAGPGDYQVDMLLPAPTNAHSHAFQRAFAGLTEGRGPTGQDSFWTWRRLIYAFLQHLNADDVEAITAFVQMEMLEAGFGAHVEFHYLHHQADGAAFNDRAEMCHRLVAASEHSGIGLTLLPVLYRYSGCDRAPLSSGQQRFGNDRDQFEALWQSARKTVSRRGDNILGVAGHSLRAVGAEDLIFLHELTGRGPFHLHLAEQKAEVDEVMQCYGQRPVEWVLDHLPLSEQFTLIHCTQINELECERLAASGAIVGLCPITEANLGDGIFPADNFLNATGQIAIGSDSNVLISLAEEIRLLEYGQRLTRNARAVLATQQFSTGRFLFEAACEGGAKASGRNSGALKIGAWGDFFSLDCSHPDLMACEGDALLDGFIFTQAQRAIDKVWSGGRLMVDGGQHIHREAIWANYQKSLRALMQKI